MNSLKKTILVCFIIVCLVISCKSDKKTPGQEPKKVEFNAPLVDKLSKMTEVDQYFAGIPQGKYKGNWDSWYAARDSVNRLHKKTLDSVLNEYGYPGFDLVGEDGESNFWVMVQHSDFDPEFQTRVLPLLKQQIDKGNAKGSHLGLLTDRIRKNTKRPQLYGTQVEYNEFGQAYIKSLEDSINVNKRRRELGMESLEEYLNGMTEMHFEMNKEHLLKQGIQEPRLYKVLVEN